MSGFRRVQDSGWDLSKTIKIRMSPGGLVKLGILIGAPLWCAVGGALALVWRAAAGLP